jgi:hypothetical protein
MAYREGGGGHMKKLLWGTLIVFGLIGSHEALKLEKSWGMTAGVVLDTTQTVSEQAPTVQGRGVAEPLLMAKSKEELKCLDQCAKTRYNCEKDNNKKEKIGTEENWKESTKCQEKYTNCMQKCDLS